MTILQVIYFIALLGAIGGVINCAVTNEFVLPRLDLENNRWRPGWVGNVLIGALAAVIIAGMYGPISQYDLVKKEGEPTSLKVSELMGAVIIGMAGGNILTQLAKSQAEYISRVNLANITKNLLDENEYE